MEFDKKKKEKKKKPNPNLVSKLLPLKTIIDIYTIICYITELQHLKFETSIKLNLSKNILIFNYGC